MATKMEMRSPALHVADGHDLIRLHGACENNLKDISVEIPKRRLTVFTGVSGSGKSSLNHGSIPAGAGPDRHRRHTRRPRRARSTFTGERLAAYVGA